MKKSPGASLLIYGALACISVATVLLILLTDAWIGNRFVPAGKWARIRHPVYHHTLASNVAARDLWEKWYDLCTDGNGFKSDCHAPTKKHFDIGIIGDSFTEGIGLAYEQTFVGMIARAHPEMTVANLGVVSYSPSVYLTKLRYLLSEGYIFREVHVYIDVGDIQDEAANYVVQEGKVLSRGADGLAWGLIDFLETMSETFPLSSNCLDRLARPVVNRVTAREPSYLEKDFPRSAWPYDRDVKGYGSVGIEGGIHNALTAMRELHALLVEHHIRLSVGVYPWPGQLRYDTISSRHMAIWKEFCRDRCEHFFNSFPAFFALVAENGSDDTIRKYYIAGDVHFNEAGNRILEETYEAAVSEGSRLKVPPLSPLLVTASEGR